MRLLSLCLCVFLCGCLPPASEQVEDAPEVSIPVPNPDIQESVYGISMALSGARADALEVAGLYQALADVLEDDGNSQEQLTSTTGEFRSAHVRAGRLCFQQKLKGKYPGLPVQIDEHIAKAIGSLDVPLTPEFRAKLVTALREIAWAAEVAK